MSAGGQPHPPWLSQGQVAVLGTATAFPGEVVETETLIALMEDRFGFTKGREAGIIAKHLAIRTRHICRDFNERTEEPRSGHSNPELAAKAVKAALDDAGLDVSNLGYLIGHTTTPHQPLPANITLVADALGYGGPHLELRQACTGFANALMIAFGLVSVPGARPVAIVGSETGTLFFDPERANDDRGQLVNLLQMGDGAGAIIIGPPENGADKISAAWFGSIGLGRAPGLQMQARSGEFDHDFAAILKSGSLLYDAGEAAARLQDCPLETADIIIPHQTSGRIGAQAAAHFGCPPERVFVNADKIGNTGSAAIWIALDHVRKSRLTSGQRVLTLGAEATKYMYGGFAYDQG
jgi:3-oxoacyl-[acyl-carrier-protein] synthase III